MQMVVSKVIGNRVVLTNENEVRSIIVPMDMMPDNIRVGDCVELAVLPDLSQLEELKQEINHILSGLAGGGFKGMRRASEDTIRARVLVALKSLVREEGKRFYLRDLSHAAQEIARVIFSQQA